MGGGGLGPLVDILGVEDAEGHAGLDLVPDEVLARFHATVETRPLGSGIGDGPDRGVVHVAVYNDGRGPGYVCGGELADFIARR